jgi:pyruvate-formate lyase-activating enzyme
VSTYELGHQPLHVASPAAAIRAAGHHVRTVDISVEEWDAGLVDWAEAVAFSVPMHTATRLALEGVEAVKKQKPEARLCLYGLYAHVVGTEAVDRVIAGEYETELVRWLDGEGSGPTVDLSRRRFGLPLRTTLPSLDRYARLLIGGEERLAGYVEATHGCVHRCRHCPVPVVYDGRTRRVEADVVLDDVAQQVEAGARHITFGDADFLNRWAHGMKVVEAMHERFPEVTFDVTTKVSHILRYASLVPLLAEQGCLFVVSAFECVNDEILRYLDKGHTAADASDAARLLRESGIEVRPSWLPFMPWTTVEDVLAILDFVVAHDLVGNVDPVQYSIRLLIPPGSLMLDVAEIAPYLGGYDETTLSYRWTAADPRTVPLQERISRIVEDEQAAEVPAAEIFCDIRDAALQAAGRPGAERAPVLARVRTDVPRLTEPWFCCAEPTKAQFVTIAADGCSSSQ